MPQYKMKVGVSRPGPGPSKNKGRIAKKNYGQAQKKNRPALPKTTTNTLRLAITRSINEVNETEARERATVDGKTFRVLEAPEVVIPTCAKTPKGKPNPSKNKNNAKK